MSNPSIGLASPEGGSSFKGNTGNLADRIESADYDSIKNGKEVYENNGEGSVARIVVTDKEEADSFVDSVEVPSNKPGELGINQNISDKGSGALGRFDQMAQDLKTEKVESAKEKAMNGTGIVGQQRDEKIKREAEEQTVRITPQTSTNNVYGSAKYITGEDRVAADIGNGKIQGFDRGLTSQGDQENSKFPSQDALKTASESAMKQVKENQLKERFGPATEDSKRRAEDLRRFRDQTELGKGESIGSSTPQDFSVEETVQSKQQVEQEKKEDKSFVAKGLEQSNQIMEEMNRILKENPNNQEVQQQIINMNNNLVIFIQTLNNINNAKEVIPSQQNPGNISAQDVQQPVEQKEQVQPTKEKQAEQQANERKWQRKALIIGAVAGVGTGVLAGAIPQVRIASMALTALAFGGTAISSLIINKTAEKLATETNPEKRAKLEKRLKNTKNVRKWSNRALSFLTGFTGGYGLTSFISTRFFQGQGLLNRIQPEATNAFTNVTGSTEKGGINFGEKINTPSQTTAGVSSESLNINPTETGLIQNGRVNLPGSSWNGNLAGNPTGTMPGGEFANINYAGGQYNMAPVQLNKDLAEAGLRVTDLTDKMGTGGVHQLLNGYLENIQKGVMNPNLKDVLGSMTDVPGASDVLSMIK